MTKGYDLFLSHANKDKLPYVNELYKELSKLGISIFFDKECIDWGDKWKEQILNGTASSEFAIIVISEKFFGREWTEKELQEFLFRQNDSKQKIVLPLLFNVTPEQVIARYPELEEIQYLEVKNHSKKDIAILFAKQLVRRLREDDPTKRPSPFELEVKGTVDIFHSMSGDGLLLGIDCILLNMENKNLLIRDIEAFMRGVKGTLVKNNSGHITVQAVHSNRPSKYNISFTPNVVPIAIDGNSSKEVSLLFDFDGRNIGDDSVSLRIMTVTDVYEVVLPVDIT